MNVPAKVLLVEDDEIAARHLRQLLPRMGYLVTDIVREGEAVVATVAAELPDIILMDISLGGKMDGISTVEELQANFDIPIIYLTANSDSAAFERAKFTEPYAYLVKPYDTNQLKIALEIALLKHSMGKKLKESEHRYRTLFDVSDNAIMLVDEQATIVMVNDRFEQLTGYAKAAAEHRRTLYDFFVPQERGKLGQRFQQANADTPPGQHFELQLVDKGGNSKTVYTNIKRVPGTATFIVSMNDISEIKKAEKEIQLLNRELQAINKGLNQEIRLRQKVEKQLRHKATHDHLTGLPNRVLLFDRMKQAFAFEERHNTLVALMVLDLDNFKNINDSLGHLCGDILLKKIALRLQKCMRQYDTVGRLGGDEFIVIINDAENIKDIVAFAEKVQALFHEPYDILGHETHVTTSIGISVYPLHGTTIESLLKKADMAMYMAKNSGRNSFRLFSDAMGLDDSTLKSMRSRRRQPLKGVTTDGDFLQSIDNHEVTH